MTGSRTRAAVVVETPDTAFPDADAFSGRARRHALFVSGEPIAVARAPGRFDVLGGIADYAGGLVLGLPIQDAALAAAQPTSDGHVVVVVARDEAEPLVRRLAEMLGTGLVGGTSPGASSFGTRVL